MDTDKSLHCGSVWSALCTCIWRVFSFVPQTAAAGWGEQWAEVVRSLSPSKHRTIRGGEANQVGFFPSFYLPTWWTHWIIRKCRYPPHAPLCSCFFSRRRGSCRMKRRPCQTGWATRASPVRRWPTSWAMSATRTRRRRRPHKRWGSKSV